ncbi:hypothetical protein INT44_007463 [Umbelopsis vinacea]|uniref:Protein kinase domain-containing protein n=1 Tax=Umbelopsis vinacea TaxID=44442 RepID=A0A8H7UEV2_9FUNG|nr:hypothetical protein INT44_007463 [Umbelopsis vinacea]
MSHHKLPAIVTSKHCLLPRPKSATTTQVTKEDIKHAESPRRPRMNTFFSYYSAEEAAQDRLQKFAGVTPSISSSAILVRPNDHDRHRRRVSSQTNLIERRMSTGKPLTSVDEDDVPVFSVNFHDYELHSPIGYGATATVTLATYRKYYQVAIKMVDMDQFEQSQIDELRREIQIMSLCRHDNVLPIHRSFMHDSKLCIVTPVMTAGSCHDVLRKYRKGLAEPVIACIIKQALRGLCYLHRNNLIHRDVKAANLLINRETGNVRLADFGVSGSLLECESRRLRNSFVGTPAWMAPEIVDGNGYDHQVDIWSLAITALELAYGHAPNSKYSPMKVLISTLRDAPPILDPSQCSHEYTSCFAQFVQLCLNKDPLMRPSAFELMKHPFITKAPPPEYLVNNIRMYNIKELQARSKDEFREKKRHFDMMLLDPWEFPTTLSSRPSEFYIHDKRDAMDDQSLVAITPPSTPPRSTSSTSSQLSDESFQYQRRRARPMSENLSDRKIHVHPGTDDTTDDERYHISRRGRFVITSEVAYR